MVIEYIRYRIAEPERRVAFEGAYARAAGELDSAPECLAYELSHGVEEPERYILRIERTSLEGHEQGFRGGPWFPPFLASVRPFIGDIEEMKHYERTDVVSGGRGAAVRAETLAEAVGGGGIEGLRRLSNSFYDRVLSDPLLAPVFADFSRTHIEHVAVWLEEVFGGATR
ncbi:hypothetical protein [Streptomyces sp. SID2563]|uniref:hypothetical protein n=1 Tax=Streptomyces sp. SID2563 TaxID=2690255 RepID=UPI001F286AED|nr:hypothetical protein [Streptomyces sp. SID2563]